MREWAGLAYSIARRFDFPGADRDDVRQEALVALWQAQRSYDGRVPLKPHLALSVHRRLCSKLREALRLKHRALNEATSLTELEGRRAAGVAQWVERRPGKPQVVGSIPAPGFTSQPGWALSSSVSDALAPLTLAERRAVVGVACGFTYAELGDSKAVDNALQRARRKLRAEHGSSLGADSDAPCGEAAA